MDEYQHIGRYKWTCEERIMHCYVRYQWIWDGWIVHVQIQNPNSKMQKCFIQPLV